MAQAESDWDRGDIRAAIGPTQKGVDILRPYVQSADGSRRIKLEYAYLLNDFSHSQPPEQAVATCEEALRILAGLGALDLADLSATSAWANIADTEAREGMTVGRVDEAERLEKQVQRLAEGVLNRRPADLQARKDLIWAPDELALAEARRFHEEAAMQFAAQSQRAAQDYLRFNPSDPEGSLGLEWADCSICNLLFREGRSADAVENARTAIQHDCDPRSRALNVWIMAEMGLVMSRWQAQCGQRDAAVQAIQEARNFYAASAATSGVLEMNDVWAESVEASSRQTGLAFGEDASVYAMSTKALPRMDHLIAGLTDPDLRATALYWKRQTLEEAARAALNLQRFVVTETAARALLSLHGETGVSSEHVFLDQPEDADWGRVLLAQAATAQGRKAEALQTLEPALARYRDAQAKGAAHVTFRQHFARALYSESLAEPTDNGGTARSREALGQAVALLQGLTEEARQLHDSKELLSWIAAAQKKLNPDAEEKK